MDTLVKRLRLIMGNKSPFHRRLWRTAVAGACSIALFAGSTAVAEDLAPLKLKLPSPAFIGTPSDSPVGADV
jgi:hypothetical protein